MSIRMRDLKNKIGLNETKFEACPLDTFLKLSSEGENKFHDMEMTLNSISMLLSDKDKKMSASLIV